MKGVNLEPISVYVRPDEKVILNRLAVMENRSVSNMLLWLALERAKAQGIDSGPWKPPSSKSGAKVGKAPSTQPPAPADEPGDGGLTSPVLGEGRFGKEP